SSSSTASMSMSRSGAAGTGRSVSPAGVAPSPGRLRQRPFHRAMIFLCCAPPARGGSKGPQVSGMDIRQLQYLAALAREKHFTRAAKACNVTQPTLSGRIRQLEQELGVPIVERGQRFHGLTAEGQRVLKWAHAILDNWSSLQQEIATLRDTE